MKRKTLMAVALIIFGISVCSAQVAATLGTWKMNEAKSKLPARFMHIKSDTYETVGDKIKVTTDATGPNGQHLRIEWVGKFDGNDYPCTGDPTGDLRSYSPVDDHTILMAKKKNGKVVTTVKIVLAPDGKSRTVYMTGVDASGNPISATAVQDRE